MVGGIIIGFVIGCLYGAISVACISMKDFDKTWDEVYELGFKHGENLEKIRQANKRKEKLLFESPEEVKKNA